MLDGKYGRARYNPAVDAYSFAMVLFEIATRKLPFFDNNWSTRRLQDEVESGARPNIPEDPTLPPPYLQLMQRCWAHEARSRPTFAQAVGELEALCLVESKIAREKATVIDPEADCDTGCDTGSG